MVFRISGVHVKVWGRNGAERRNLLSCWNSLERVMRAKNSVIARVKDVSTCYNSLKASYDLDDSVNNKRINLCIFQIIVYDGKVLKIKSVIN